MDHNMVLSFDYAKGKRQRRQANVPLLQAILMAKQTRWSNACDITQCSMTRATPDAPGSHYRVATCSVLPRRPPGWQWSQIKTPTLLAISMAVAVQRNNTVHITQWRRFMAFLKVTKRRHHACTHSDNINQTCLPPFCLIYLIVNSSKKGSSWNLFPNNNMCMKYQTLKKAT